VSVRAPRAWSFCNRRAVSLVLLAAQTFNRDRPEGIALAYTDASGRFTFEGLAAGEYLLAVNPGGEASSTLPYRPTFYGGGDAATAARLGVGFGMPTELSEPLVLPPPLPTRSITVDVACQDGSKPPAFSVSARSTGRPAEDERGMEVAGVETLRLLHEAAYTITVTVYLPDGPRTSFGARLRRPVELSTIDVAAGRPGGRLQIVAPFSGCTERR
jgi:hypothetical protein